MTEHVKPPFMSDSVYDILMWLSLVFFPALGALYFVFATTWDLPNPEGVMASILALGTFIGALLKVSNAQHRRFEEVENTGEISITEVIDPELEEAGLPNDLEVRFGFPNDLQSYSEGDILRMRVGETQIRGKHALPE